MRFNELAKAIAELMVENVGVAIDENDDRRLSLMIEDMLTRLKDIQIEDPYAPGAFDVFGAYNSGNDYKRSGDYLNAIALYLIAATKDCFGPGPYNNIAAILKILGLYQSAYNSYKVASLRYCDDYLLILRKSLLGFQLKKDDWYHDLRILIKDDRTFETYSNELKNLYRGDNQINDVNNMFKEFKVRFKTHSKPSKTLANKESNKSKYDEYGYNREGFNRYGYNKQGKKKSVAPISDMDINISYHYSNYFNDY
ncbi:MAG: hypothetical protein ACRC5T_02820 [Cetobacterium sp.]